LFSRTASEDSNISKEFWNGNLQRLRNPLNINERHVSLFALDPADIGSIQATDVGLIPSFVISSIHGTADLRQPLAGTAL
jgi:hypothetical protein